MRLVHIAIIDDNEADQLLVAEFFKRDKIVNEIEFYSDPDLLIDRMNNVDKPEIDLVFIDINLGTSNGFDVLKQIRAIDKYRLVPIIVLSGSSDIKDVNRAVGFAVSAYVTKPLHIGKLQETVHAVDNFGIGVLLNNNVVMEGAK